MEFSLKSFVELSNTELYSILQLRAEVFVVEQDCVYQDLDGKDEMSHHVLGFSDDFLAAYTRIVPPGISYDDYASIGRVVTSMKARKHGYGKALMNKSIGFCKELHPDYDIKISAQTYLLKFYNELGFKKVGEGYLEDGIPHIGMVYHF